MSRSRLVGRLMIHKGGERLHHGNPLGFPDNPSRPSLGVKVLLGKEQYGTHLDEEGLRRAGITVTKNMSIEFDLYRLTEGGLPPTAEVPDADAT